MWAILHALSFDEFIFLVLQKEDVEPLAGYLSLHQNSDGLALKWTPNQLMNGGGSEEDESTVDRRFNFDFF